MPWKPGQSGNPGGMVAGQQRPFREALARALATPGPNGQRALVRVALALIEKAAAGDVPAIKELADRIDGKVLQTIAGADGSGPLQITITIVDPTRGLAGPVVDITPALDVVDEPDDEAVMLPDPDVKSLKDNDN